MPVQRVFHAVPVSLAPRKRLAFKRARLLDGIYLQLYEGELAAYIEMLDKQIPARLPFRPTHLIYIDQSEYFRGLDARLKADGLTRPKEPVERVDVMGIRRQVLIAATLVGHLTWEAGNPYTLDKSDPDFPYHQGGMSAHPLDAMPKNQFLYGGPVGWFSNVSPQALRRKVLQLDGYYRSGAWRNDRLSIALGYLWSALTTSHAELCFSAFCMALEALVSTQRNEITHILAERCAVLIRPPGADRIAAYEELKQLYTIRSAIVHGSSGLKGVLTWETLAVSAKASNAPHSKVLRLLSYVVDLINATLDDKEFLQSFQTLTKRKDGDDHAAVNTYFLHRLLS